jgi:hypothetical protein
MNADRYPTETLDDDEDNGTMPDNVAELAEAVVGHRIVSAHTEERKAYDWSWRSEEATVLTLDNGKRVILLDTGDCCAFTQLESFLLHPERVDPVITGVGTTDGYQKWHIYADYGDIMEMDVAWSAGNPFYYGYGFDIRVEEHSPSEAP